MDAELGLVASWLCVRGAAPPGLGAARLAEQMEAVKDETL